MKIGLREGEVIAYCKLSNEGDVCVGKDKCIAYEKCWGEEVENYYHERNGW